MDIFCQMTSWNLSHMGRSDGTEKRELLARVRRTSLYLNWLNNQEGCSLN